MLECWSDGEIILLQPSSPPLAGKYMKVHLDCVPCQQRQALKILRLINDNEELHQQVLRTVMTHLSEAEWDTDPMSMMKGMHDIITHETGTTDPYKEVKYHSNTEILQLYPQLQEYVKTADDPLLIACKLAIAGNIMDFGAQDYFNIEETIQHVLHTDFGINDYDRLHDALDSAASLLLFADNAGEIVFDKLLLETILQIRPLQKITVVVKERPIINDATMEDLKQAGLTELPNLDVHFVNTAPHGQERAAWIPPEVKTWIQNHDVAISKGQANYEMMSEWEGLFFLLIAKCQIVADHAGTDNGAMILKYNGSGTYHILSKMKDAIFRG